MERLAYFRNKKTRRVITIDMVEEKSLYDFLIKDKDWEQVVITSPSFQGLKLIYGVEEKPISTKDAIKLIKNLIK